MPSCPRNVSLSRKVVAHIKRLRQARNVTQAQLSGSLAAAGHPTAWSLMEHRQSAALTIDQAFVVALHLDLSLDDLVNGALREVCVNCSGLPPAGFTCNVCKRS